MTEFTIYNLEKDTKAINNAPEMQEALESVLHWMEQVAYNCPGYGFARFKVRHALQLEDNEESTK